MSQRVRKRRNNVETAKGPAKLRRPTARLLVIVLAIRPGPVSRPAKNIIAELPRRTNVSRAGAL